MLKLGRIQKKTVPGRGAVKGGGRKGEVDTVWFIQCHQSCVLHISSPSLLHSHIDLVLFYFLSRMGQRIGFRIPSVN